jgi:hypothetical protein
VTTYLTGGTTSSTNNTSDTLSTTASSVTAMGPSNGDCYSTGGSGCTFTVSGTAVPDNAVALGAGTVDRLKIQLDASPGTTTTRGYTFVACQAVETTAATPTFTTTCSTLAGGAGVNLSCQIEGASANGGTRQTSGWSCADTSGTLTIPASGGNAAVLFWIEAQATATAPNVAVQATWSARFVGQSTNQ